MKANSKILILSAPQLDIILGKDTVSKKNHNQVTISMIVKTSKGQ